MQILLSKVTLCSALLLTATACQQQPSSSESAQTRAAVSATAEVAMSMRTTDVRIATGAQQNKSCNIERVNNIGFGAEPPHASRSRPVIIDGWIVDEASQAVPANLKLRLQTANGVSAWEQDVSERNERADVAGALGSDAYLQSGFRVNLDVAEMLPGDYVVYLAFDGAGSEAICGLGRRFTLTP